jgi:hypothetical protein
VAKPDCPRPGCSGGTVSKEGFHQRDGVRRQRWLHTLADGSHHRFTGALSVARADGGPSVCLACRSPLTAGHGPAAPARFGFDVETVAEALVGLGRGASYTEVAQRARAQTPERGRTYARGPRTVVNGQTAANWLARFGPIVAASHQETAWPETLVLDSTVFTHTDTWTGRRAQLFTVHAAYGYPAGSSEGRLWALASSPTNTAADWQAFLASLTGRPKVVVLDDDKAIQAGVRQCWPGGSGPHLHQCEHHLYARARAAMERDQLPDIHPLHEQLNVAFTSPQAWAEFAAAVHANRRVELAAWVDHWGPQLQGQLIRRAAHPAGVPGHWANGAIEHPLKLVGAVVGRRAWTLRNRARMDLLLELVRLRVNKQDNARRYTLAITEDLTAGGHTHCIPDIADQDIAGAKVYSLRP